MEENGQSYLAESIFPERPTPEGYTVPADDLHLTNAAIQCIVRIDGGVRLQSSASLGIPHVTFWNVRFKLKCAVAL